MPIMRNVPAPFSGFQAGWDQGGRILRDTQEDETRHLQQLRQRAQYNAEMQIASDPQAFAVPNEVGIKPRSGVTAPVRVRAPTTQQAAPRAPSTQTPGGQTTALRPLQPGRSIAGDTQTATQTDRVETVPVTYDGQLTPEQRRAWARYTNESGRSVPRGGARGGGPRYTDFRQRGQVSQEAITQLRASGLDFRNGQLVRVRPQWSTEALRFNTEDEKTGRDKPGPVPRTGGELLGAKSGGAKSIVATDLPPEAAEFLDVVASTESPGYDVIYGGSRFSTSGGHPRRNIRITNGPNAGDTSSAAGRYQFLGSTWDEVLRETGLPDSMDPANQDRAAWYLAQRNYRRATGRDLITDWRAGRRDEVLRELSDTWTSLPSGIEENAIYRGGQQAQPSVSAQQEQSGPQLINSVATGQIGNIMAMPAVQDATGQARALRRQMEIYRRHGLVAEAQNLHPRVVQAVQRQNVVIARGAIDQFAVSNNPQAISAVLNAYYARETGGLFELAPAQDEAGNAIQGYWVPTIDGQPVQEPMDTEEVIGHALAATDEAEREAQRAAVSAQRTAATEAYFDIYERLLQNDNAVTLQQLENEGSMAVAIINNRGELERERMRALREGSQTEMAETAEGDPVMIVRQPDGTVQAFVVQMEETPAIGTGGRRRRINVPVVRGTSGGGFGRFESMTG